MLSCSPAVREKKTQKDFRTGKPNKTELSDTGVKSRRVYMERVMSWLKTGRTPRISEKVGWPRLHHTPALQESTKKNTTKTARMIKQKSRISQLTSSFRDKLHCCVLRTLRNVVSFLLHFTSVFLHCMVGIVSLREAPEQWISKGHQRISQHRGECKMGEKFNFGWTSPLKSEL